MDSSTQPSPSASASDVVATPLASPEAPRADAPAGTSLPSARPASWLERHAVELTAAAVLAIVGATAWTLWSGSSRTNPHAAPTPAPGPSAAAAPGLTPAENSQLPTAPEMGAVCRIDTGSISAHVLQQVVKTPKWAPLAGQIGQYVGLALKVEASKLAQKGWIVLTSSAILAVPEQRDFTQQVQADVFQSLQTQIPLMLAKLPATAAANVGDPQATPDQGQAQPQPQTSASEAFQP